MEKPGFQLGAYSVSARLGVGGMGEVWLATRDQKSFVLKTLLPHLADDPRMLEMFIKEARVASLVAGPNVVRMFEHGEHDGQHFLVLEYVDGVSLDGLLMRTRLLPPMVAASVAAQSCAGLSAIHEQTQLTVVHRDISPSNLLISSLGVVKVADFGIAKTFTTDPGGTTTVGTTKGKIAYMSPEQARGQQVDVRTDIFALGVCLYQMLAGDLPYAETKNDYEMLAQVVYGRRKVLAEIAPRTPAALATIVDKAMALNISVRWQTARAMREALDRFLATTEPGAAARELGERVRACAQPAQPARPSVETAPVRRVEGRAVTGAPQVAAAPAPGSVSATVRAGGAAADAALPLLSAVAVPALGVGGPVPLGDGSVAPTATAPAQGPVGRGRPIVIAAGLAGLVALGVVIAVRAAQQPAQATPSPSAEPIAALPLGPVPRLERHAEPVGTPPEVAVTAPAETPRERSAPGAARAHVTFETSPACDVYVGKRRLGRSPVEVAVGAEPVTLKLVSEPDGISLDYTLALRRGEATRRFEVPRATLDLRVSPWAEVTLDGSPRGLTPLKPLVVYAGRHTLDLVNGDLQVRKHVDFELAPGESRTIREKLE